MASQQTEKLRDCAVITTIHLFGSSYFLLFVLHFLIFHFPSTPEAILNSVAVLFFCAGVLFWCISTILYRILAAAAQGNTTGWQKIEFIGTLVLIGATTIPFVVLQFAAESSARLSYLSALTLVTVGFLVDLFAVEPDVAVIRERFPYHCASLGLLMLVPAIHALSEHQFAYTPLVLQFGKIAIYNALVGILFLLRPLERMRVITGWQPSLYAMHLVLVYNAITYSRVILHVLVDL
ncbi:Hly-III related [Penicillium camemberti]|uniref:Hly-III related n=1 Tax=Penicillium camemberti (strain FM 013) TaxID=1429867 RepID=A0A0G4PT03_PENC3|nr:Hly-III related [Penicillium camemberti]